MSKKSSTFNLTVLDSQGALSAPDPNQNPTHQKPQVGDSRVGSTRLSPSSALDSHPISRFITAYSPKRKVSLSFSLPSRAKQSFKDECDINRIMQRYEATGVLEHIRENPPQFADVIGMDYQAAMIQIAAANSLFGALPARVRDRFDNDPAQFVDFMADERNLEEAVELGLANPRPVEQAVEPAPASAPAPANTIVEAPAVPPSPAEKGGKKGV